MHITMFIIFLSFQEIHRIQNIIQDLKLNDLFFDTDFVAEDNSLFYNDHTQASGIQWARPKVSLTNEVLVC